jgi:hypothetical protein
MAKLANLATKIPVEEQRPRQTASLKHHSGGQRAASLKRSAGMPPRVKCTKPREPPEPPYPCPNDELLRMLIEQLAVPVEVAGEALGIGRSLAYTAIRNGELPFIRIGRRLTVPTAPLRAMLQIEK